MNLHGQKSRHGFLRNNKHGFRYSHVNMYTEECENTDWGDLVSLTSY
jgi:hypothetical protein